MAVNDYYVCRTQDGVYGGKFYLPTWVTNQAKNTWGTVPATNLLSSLNPKDNPAINPNFPNRPEWDPANNSFESVANAWCGWVYDYVRHRIRTGLSGGHGDRAGNDEYGIDINQESPSWFMMRSPSGAVGNLLTTNDGQEETGNYADGQPRAIHSYNKQVFVPSVGLIVAVQGNCAWAAKGPARILKYDHSGAFIGAGATNAFLGNGFSSGAGSCYVENRHCVYTWGTNTGRLQKYDIATDTWSQVGTSVAVSAYSALEYLPEHDCLLWFNSFLTNGFAVFDLQTNTYHYPAISGSWIGGMTKPRGEMQPRRVQAGEIAVWDNSTATTSINKMSYASNPRTDTWQISQYPVAPSNTVTPTVRTIRGTYGRFFIDHELGIMGVINEVNQPIYFYRYK